ncbi:M48 family metallopeptidase [Isoalcanivorax indicus]|uniref:M48 family metallopeptidase n=1 Tax=Isoalcanivorax indicus TaxID=2202653 RepID=UPI000DBA3E89|nr:M48 family metallopeptidase [Isoalcanivorax indicus]
MNFFEQQARARRRTGLLVLYFALAVLLTAAAVNLVIYAGLMWLGAPVPLTGWLLSPASAWITAITLLVVVGGSLVRLWQLRGGGPALANLLGARQIDPASHDADERRLINVVEEMAIASGIPVPQLFVLDKEEAINAFVAGFRPTESSVMVTRGTLTQLNRDELQGVIAHEFSHIFNADMRLNLRLMAVLTGILAIGKVGEILLRSNARRGLYVRSNSRNGGGIAALMAFGLALTAIGYIGLFFGRLIKAAISRQRELLADASSVQFTRNPAGIANALIRIRNSEGSFLDSPQAEDMSHMCFAPTLRFSLRQWLATHPDIDARLAAIGPEWPARARVRAADQVRAANATPAGDLFSDDAFGSKTVAPVGFAPAHAGQAAAPALAPGSKLSSQVGTVAPAHMGYARRILESVPDALKDVVHDGQGAERIIYALAASVSHSDPGSLIPALGLPDNEASAVAALVPAIQALGTRLRLPLVDMAIPVLKRRPQAEQDALLRRLEALIRADQRMTLFEFLLLHLLRDHLHRRAARNQPVRHRSLRAVGEPLRVLLSAMVHASGQRDEQASALFAAVGAVMLPPGSTLLPRASCNLARLAPALEELAGLMPLLKASVVDACADIVLADKRVQVGEAELLRAVCTLLDCPMPPLFTDVD